MAMNEELRRYSSFQVLVNNLPYAVMVLLGTIIFAYGLGQPWNWTAGGLYLFYGLAGVVWIMVFMCPYCRYYDTDSCPCGYGIFSVKLRPRGEKECFDRQFKKHIPVIVPLWFIPLLVIVPVIVRCFSWPLVGLSLLFALDAFLILPLVSTGHGCKDCPQRGECPWMKNKAGSG